MRLAYLINVHPAPSHTFIRREIAALRTLGVDPRIVSLRTYEGALPDPQDEADRLRTYVVHSSGWWWMLLEMMRAFADRPVHSARVLTRAVKQQFRAGAGRLRAIGYFIHACSVARWLSQNAIDHLHVHMGSNAASVAQIVRWLGGPNFSLTLHGPEEFDEPVRWCLPEKLADALFVVTVSQGRLDELHAGYPHVREKLHLVRCGVDAALRQLAAEQSRVPECACFVSVGRLCERKNHRALIEAVDRVRRVHDDVRLTIVGDGPLRAQLEQLIRQRGLDRHTRLLGTLDSDAVAREISAARALVVPSRSETLPCVIMEAFALHRPVICADIGSQRELLRHHENGWLLAEPTAEQLADALLDALSRSTEELSAMGARGAGTIARHYDSEHQAAKLLKLFQQYVPSSSQSADASDCALLDAKSST